MGTETAETPVVSTEEELVVTEPTEPTDPVESGEGEEGEPQEPQDVEIVLNGDDGSQPDTQRGIRKRINKLNNKVAKAEDRATDTDKELANEQEKNKLLRLALEQSKAPSAAPILPDQADYDEGVRDPKYVAALNAYNLPLIAAEVQKQTAGLKPVQADVVDPALVKKQTKHYERADELGAKDFEETEDKAISILGKEVVNQLIKGSDESHIILYYLGKNPGKAEDIAKLIGDGPNGVVKAVLQLGRLSAQLSVKPKGNSEPTPDPDEELRGGSPSAGQTNKHQKKVDAAREKAQESGAISLVLAAKKAALEAGVTVT